MEVSEVPVRQNNKPESPEQSNGLIFTDIYKKAIDANIFTRTDDPIFPFEADPQKVKMVLKPYVKELEDIAASQKDDINSADLPADIDLDKEARDGTQRVISMLVSSGLADVTAIRGAAKYVGPRNTIYKPEEIDYHFTPTREYMDFLDNQGTERDYSKPIPPPPHSRSEFFKLEIGGVGLRSNTGENLRLAKKLGIPMDVTQAMRLELTRASGHEYGHAILRGLDNTGRNTFEEAKAQGFIESPDLLDFTAATTHDEYFARGIEVALEKRYLTDMGCTPEQIESFMGAKQKNFEKDKNAAYSFLRYANSLGYTPKEIIKLQNAFMAGAANAYEGEDVNFYLWHVADIVSYRTPPYTEEQLASIMKNESQKDL